MTDIDRTVGICIVLVIAILWAVFAFALRRIGTCELCRNKFNEDDMVHPKVCKDCWYSEDEETQDRAFELAAGYKYEE